MKKIKYLLILETDKDDEWLGYYSTLDEAKNAIESDRNGYIDHDVKFYQKLNACYCIIDLEKNYGRTFESVEEFKEFLEDNELNLDTNYSFKF